MLTLNLLSETIFRVLWAALRVSGVVMIAPIFGAMFIPTRIRLIITMVIAVAMLPVEGPIPAFSPLSIEGFLAVSQELAFGIAIGFMLKIAIETAVTAGQLVSTGMGLSFATVVDPQAGGMPLLGRFYLIIATLLLLAGNAHLQLIQVLAQSYSMLPIGSAGLGAGAARQIADFGGLMFVGAVKLALPAMTAMLMVNVAFGVISRAAPTLNLFAVGFPITLLMGFLIILLDVDAHGTIWNGQFAETLAELNRILGSR